MTTPLATSRISISAPKPCSPGFAALALGLALLGAASMLCYYIGFFMPRVRAVSASRNLAGGYSFGDDLYPIWLTSRAWLWEGGDLYSEQTTRAIQIGLFGRTLDARIPTDPPPDYRTFAYPAFTDFLFWPLAELPFSVARLAFSIVLASLVVAMVFVWMRALSWRIPKVWLIVVLLLTLSSYPVLEGLYAGQLGLFVGFLLAVAIWALRRGHLLLSGILMALTTIKPQMTALVILYLFFWITDNTRRRFAVGFLVTILVLIGAPLVVWPHWIQAWGHVLVGYHHYGTPPLVSDVLASPLGPRVATPTASVMVAIWMIVGAVLAWRNRAAAANALEFWLTLSLLLSITTITLLPGQAVHDHVILLPGIFLLASCRELFCRPILRALRALGLVTLLWPWLAALSLITLHPLLSGKRFYSKAIFVLPLRTTAVFPFVVLGLLALVLREWRRPPPRLQDLSVPG